MSFWEEQNTYGDGVGGLSIYLPNQWLIIGPTKFRGFPNNMADSSMEHDVTSYKTNKLADIWGVSTIHLHIRVK